MFYEHHFKRFVKIRAMPRRADQLPDDIDALKALLAEQRTKNDALSRHNDQLTAKVISLESIFRISCAVEPLGSRPVAAVTRRRVGSTLAGPRCAAALMPEVRLAAAIVARASVA